MNYDGDDFVELLARVLDWPRKNVIDPENPSFANLVNARIAGYCGAKRVLKPEAFYGITPTPGKRQPQNLTQSTRRQHYTAPIAKKPSKKLGSEKTPLDGSEARYLDGPFLNPERKIDVSHCCFCWNSSKPCKVLNSSGECRKLHICAHDDCRTLRHHGHRRCDHQTI